MLPGERGDGKIQGWHRDRLAVIYVRQSSRQQVVDHGESTRLQYGLTERAAAVAQYLRETKDVPMRRILAPAGYGATHLFASSADPQDRPLDRSVDVKVLVNKTLGPAQ